MSGLRPTAAPTAIAASAFLHVVGAEQRHLERAGRLALPPQAERVEPAATFRSCACQSAPSDRPNVSTRQRAFAVSARASASSAPTSSRPRRGIRLTKPPEGQPDRLEVRVDVGVVVLDVVDDGDVGQVLQELRGLVEERAVVLVPFDHELAAAADAVAAAEVVGDAADEHARIGAAVRQQPAGQRRRRRLAVRAGDDDRARAPEEVIADRPRAASSSGSCDRALPRARGCRARSRCRRRRGRDRRVMCSALVALQRRDLLLRQEVAHRRIDVLVRSADVEALLLSIAASVAIARPAHANQVDSLHRAATAASSMISAGCGAGDDARADAERQRHAGAVGVAGRQAEQHRPAKVREQIGDDRLDGRARRRPARRTAAARRRRSPTARDEQARQPQLRQHAIDAIGTLGDFVDEQDVPRRRIERIRRAERRQQAASACRRRARPTPLRGAAPPAADARCARPARPASARA